MDVDIPGAPFAETEFITRFSSRHGKLAVFLKDRLKGATSYDRIAGYFRSSVFELVHEEISDVDDVRIICNSDLDPRDIAMGIAAEDTARQSILEKWNSGDDPVESFRHRERYQRLYELLKKGNVKIKVVSKDDAPFLHGKAGVIRRPDGSSSSFMGSINETAQGWAHSYEIVWEDRSPDGVNWVQAEFDALWKIGRKLPEAVIEEIGRSARKVQVTIENLPPERIGQSALVESPLYRRGEELMPWQRAFVSLFVQERERYGKCRLLLADEVGVGKTLSMATAALVSALLDDGPVLILCPATLGVQWQTELLDKLNVPTALWLSSKKMWRDPHGHLIRTRGAEDIARCPYRIGIVSTGLITQNTPEVEVLLRKNYGMVILDEAHKARKKRQLGREPMDGNLLKFMMKIAGKTRHLILGTATPIQTDVTELWDLLEILNHGATHVLGREFSTWRKPDLAREIMTGEKIVLDEGEAWNLLRNPLPPSDEDHGPFNFIYQDLDIEGKAVDFTDAPFTDLAIFTRDDLRDAINGKVRGIGFFQYHNPISRHVVLRRRKTLEDAGLMKRIAVDIWPNAYDPNPALFEGKAVRTSADFDHACEAVEKFTQALAQRTKGAGFMLNLLRQRICSSIASGLSTCRKLVEKRQLDDTDIEDEIDDLLAEDPELAGVLNDEIGYLREVIRHLERNPTDPKLDACIYFLEQKGWLQDGCIIFSQYYDTARWIASHLSARFEGETVAVYGGSGKSGIFIDGQWRTVDREDIKKAVRDYRIRLVVATDAAAEGLNLQALATLINVDLPWNPSRLEQRIGRIKRYGQKREAVKMANLVYQNTVDERVYDKLSERMKDRYDLLGSLPDVIEDAWIDDIEAMEEGFREFTRNRKSTADVFELRYGDFLSTDGADWQFCEQVLDKDEAMKVLSSGW
ncbi:phospholipase D-like domain-containing protein [Mesorhizobium sp. M1050]|uniref:phospholipase D-like domain-containing anti-phage protein n=1 Tax=Mesorhizobium sp. M1050 TaxID=2957051 RepID=UPI00333BFBB8